MAKSVTVWFDPEADFLDVKFSDAPGYMRETLISGGSRGWGTTDQS